MTQKLLPAAETIAALSGSFLDQSKAADATSQKMLAFLETYERAAQLHANPKEKRVTDTAVLALTIRPRIPLLHIRKALGWPLPPVLLVYKGKATGRFFASMIGEHDGREAI